MGQLDKRGDRDVDYRDEISSTVHNTEGKSEAQTSRERKQERESLWEVNKFAVASQTPNT